MSGFRFGVDVLLQDAKLRARLAGKRVALLGHPASVTSPRMGFKHSLDALAACKDLQLTAAFGPQHGMKGDKQDNMVETEDELDPVLGIPVFSLYGKVRKPTDKMLEHFDVLLYDVQDVGCRIYTFLTTLLYVLEACARTGKAVWVLDRPNPAGREAEGTLLVEGWKSFVGAAVGLPMRHGLTMGEAARWFVKRLKIDVQLHVVQMQGYEPDAAPGFGWPVDELPWVNPSPNAATLNMARAYAGSVMIEGTTLSEGRGTTRPLELQGAPELDMPAILNSMRQLAPQWMEGCLLRPAYFEPTFHKHMGKLCAGFQVHTDFPGYVPTRFKPYRLYALWFKAILKTHPNYPIWRDFPYEYETDRLAIDLINGGPALREWVEDLNAPSSAFEAQCARDEKVWLEDRREFLMY